MPSSRSTCTIALVSDRDEAHARRDLWDPIERAWPDFAAPPVANFIDAETFSAGEGPIPGLAAIIDLESPSENDLLASIHERLWRHSLPAALLFRSPAPDHRALNGRGVMVIAPDESPVATAAAIAAVAERQRSVESLTRDLSTAQRFQSGLTGVMDKLHEELRLAAVVQKELLPKSFPALPGINFQVFFRSAGYVSGDTYDVQQLDDHHIGFFIADAVGHGVPAALMTMIINRGIRMRTLAGDHYRIHEPSEVLVALNKELIRHHSEAPRFASAIYGVMDTRDRTVTIAGAGHPPAIIYAPDGSTTPVETEGSLLGVFADDDFAQTTINIEPDHMLVLYSDGFETAFPDRQADCYERRLPNRRYLDRFAQLAGDWRDNDIHVALSNFTTEVDAQAGSLHQLDDLTAMIITPTADAAADHLFADVERAADHTDRRPARAA